MQCPRGTTLACDDLMQVTGVPLTEQVLIAVCSPWHQERSDTINDPAQRVWPSDCEKARGIATFGEEVGMAFFPDCFNRGSCLECPRAVEAIEDMLLDLVEYGWEGEAGRRLRLQAGTLMR